MGFVVSYLAIQNPEPEAVYSMLGVAPTGAREEVPEAPLLGARLPDGWTLIFCNRRNHRFVRLAVLARLSKESPVIACEVDEREGISSATGWSDGQERWTLIAGPDGFDTRGTLPAEFAPILERHLTQHRDAPEEGHLFEIPVACFRQLAGFRYDSDLAGSGPKPFAVLVERGLEGVPIPGLLLQLEDEPTVDAASLEHVRAVVDWLTPHGGPSFLVLEGRGDDYAQTAGGDGVYTVEWREYQGHNFRHWVAGLPDRPTGGKIVIPTNGYRVTVQRHERLKAEDVKTILTAYAGGSPRPEQFVWRDVSSRFL